MRAQIAGAFAPDLRLVLDHKAHDEPYKLVESWRCGHRTVHDRTRKP
jgi:hypothetical protein